MSFIKSYEGATFINTSRTIPSLSSFSTSLKPKLVVATLTGGPANCLLENHWCFKIDDESMSFPPRRALLINMLVCQRKDRVEVRLGQRGSAPCEGLRKKTQAVTDCREQQFFSGICCQSVFRRVQNKQGRVRSCIYSDFHQGDETLLT